MKLPTSKGAPAPSSSSEPPHRKLGRPDLPSATLELARFLIGKLLIRRLDDGTVLSGRIVETEAYGIDDPASHAYRGLTKRNRAMFAEHAHLYVYLIYGTSYCLNVSTEGPGIGAAVLIRAADPLTGLDRLRAQRGRPGLRDHELARGPGNLCRAFGIGPAFDGLDLDVDPRLVLGDDGAPVDVGTSVRIGLTRAAERPHRFYARGSRALSGRRSLSP
ncbi:MAG TPA: DNA-3-methyladenine glycosylase [Candidatus Lustribacter sp.]